MTPSELIDREGENLGDAMPEMRGKKPGDFIDKTILAELEQEGFFARLYNR